jgi:V/A-type H+-transporting ATPase subunit E
MLSKIENITNSILEKAETEATDILDNAHKKQADLLAENKKTALQESELIISKSMAQVETIIDKIIMEHQRIYRDKVLEAKQFLLNTVFSKAAERFSDINEDTLINQFKKYIQLNNPPTSSIIEIPTNRPLFKETVCSYGFNVQENAQITSGFSIIRGGIAEICDYISIMNFIREDLEPELLEILTGRSDINEKG